MVPDPPDKIDLSAGGAAWSAFAVSGITGTLAGGNTTYDYAQLAAGGGTAFGGREKDFYVEPDGSGGWTFFFEGESFFQGEGEWPWLVNDWTAQGDGAGSPVLAWARGKGFKVAADGVVPTVQAIAATNLAGADNDFNFTAVLAGRLGNDTRIRFVNPAANNAPLSVVVVDGRDVTVNLATNGGGAITTTAAQVKTALDANPASAALITTVLNGTGTGVVTALAWLKFSGGTGGLPLPPETVAL